MKQRLAGYKEINTPADRHCGKIWTLGKIWKHMFTSETQMKIFAVKPMNCPGCVQVFNQGLKL